MDFQSFNNKISFEAATSGVNDPNEKRSFKKIFRKNGFMRMIKRKKIDVGEDLNKNHNKEKKSSIFKKINKKNIIIGIVVIAVILFLVPRLFSTENTTSQNNNTDSIRVKPAVASVDVNRTFSFPLKNDADEEVGELEYEIIKAEKLDEIVVQGSKATAVEGRTFLILNLKIKNVLNQSLEINTKDYVRLSVNGNKDDWLAPDIHNDPVKVQAISTKNTRIGFPINDSDKDLVLRVGEINGEKEEVPLNF